MEKPVCNRYIDNELPADIYMLVNYIKIKFSSKSPGIHKSTQYKEDKREPQTRKTRSVIYHENASFHSAITMSPESRSLQMLMLLIVREGVDAKRSHEECSVRVPGLHTAGQRRASSQCI